MRSSRILAFLILGVVACKGGGDKAAPSTGESAKPASVDLIAAAPAPAGLTFERIDEALGSLEVPKGTGWAKVDNQIEGPDGTVVMLQGQPGIDASQLDEYLASYDEVQKRDAPKYANATTTKGTVNGVPAARVSATFDNGTKFVTRDYVIFTKAGVVMIGGRTPQPNAAKLDGLVDYMARSYKSK